MKSTTSIIQTLRLLAFVATLTNSSSLPAFQIDSLTLCSGIDLGTTERPEHARVFDKLHKEGVEGRVIRIKDSEGESLILKIDKLPPHNPKSPIPWLRDKATHEHVANLIAEGEAVIVTPSRTQIGVYMGRYGDVQSELAVKLGFTHYLNITEITNLSSIIHEMWHGKDYKNGVNDSLIKDLKEIVGTKNPELPQKLKHHIMEQRAITHQFEAFTSRTRPDQTYPLHVDVYRSYTNGKYPRTFIDRIANLEGKEYRKVEEQWLESYYQRNLNRFSDLLQYEVRDPVQVRKAIEFAERHYLRGQYRSRTPFMEQTMK